MFRIERSNRRSVSAHDVIGENLELRLLVHLRPWGQENSLGFHGAIGLLRRLLDNHLPLKDADSVVIDDRAIEFPTDASGRGMNDLQRRIGASNAVYERQSAKRRFGSISSDPDKNLPARKLAARNESKGCKLRALGELANLRFDVQPRLVANDRDMFRSRAVAQHQNGHRVPLNPGMRALEQLDKRRLRSPPQRDSRPRID